MKKLQQQIDFRGNTTEESNCAIAKKLRKFSAMPTLVKIKIVIMMRDTKNITRTKNMRTQRIEKHMKNVLQVSIYL